MANSQTSVLDENARLKKQLEELQQKREQDNLQYEQRIEKERSSGRSYGEQVEQKSAELSSLRSKMSRLTKQLDEEVTRRDIAQSEAIALQSRIQDAGDGVAFQGKGVGFEKDRGSKEDEQAKGQASTKLLRVIEHWMTHKDLQQALLRNAGINDMSFSTLVQVLADCPSLQTLDLAGNQLTMDSCSEVCNLITAAPSLSFVSLADNNFSLRSIGYFMTAVMERQNTKKLMPLDILDIHGNEGIVAAMSAPAPEALMKQINFALGPTRLPGRGAELIAQISRALWRFLHDTGHPQVRSSNAEEVAFHIMDKSTIRKMESALMKLLVLEDDNQSGANDASSGRNAVTADLVFVTIQELPSESVPPLVSEASAKEGLVSLPPILGSTQSTASLPQGRRSMGVAAQPQQQMLAPELRDPFSDLKAAFEPQREKLLTFNLKQIVTRNGTVLMNMLERLLETTEIDARDVETEQTLLEYACQTGNMGLAKLCYRRGANLSARSKKGDTAFNIVTSSRRYDIMEFLHKYGVKVNSCDDAGQTALHIASTANDVDGVCRLLEWGADVNLRDKKRKTSLHVACAGGHFDVTMLLLEVGAELNAQDEKGYTPAAWAEARNHFALMDRLVMLGGKGHGLSQKGSALALSKSAKGLGDLNVSPQMMKSSSLGRIGKVKVKGLPEPLRASLKH